MLVNFSEEGGFIRTAKLSKYQQILLMTSQIQFWGKTTLAPQRVTVFSYIHSIPGGSDCRKNSPGENQPRGVYASVDISARTFADR
jgi:hypothetical protein